MAEASIPVNLFNPGQVFACLGFLEASEALLGNADGRFDWSNQLDVRFHLRSLGDCDLSPCAVVLEFLANAKICRYVPAGYQEATPKKNKNKSTEDDDTTVVTPEPPSSSDTFPGGVADRMALPIRLVGSLNGREHVLEVSHWADASSRNDFKLYAGNRSAEHIVRAMLSGTREKPKKGQSQGGVKTHGLKALWNESRPDLEARPFDMLTAVGGSFNFDPRGAWTGIDAGYSPNDQKHSIAASPVVEMLAAIGLEHARPGEYDTRQVRYSVWGSFLPPMLARPSLAGAPLAVPMRRFRFLLDLSGKNKVVTFAQEEL